MVIEHLDVADKESLFEGLLERSFSLTESAQVLTAADKKVIRMQLSLDTLLCELLACRILLLRPWVHP